MEEVEQFDSITLEELAEGNVAYRILRSILTKL
jgi:hypothetical protein